MLEDLWNRFKSAGYTGSISSRSLSGMEGVHFTEKSDSGEDDSFIHEAVYGMDPDYTAVCIIRTGFNGDKGSLPVIDVDGWQDAAKAAEALDSAILNGLGHTKSFVITGSGAVVRFGYAGDDLF